jgi:hypothetical protein
MLPTSRPMPSAGRIVSNVSLPLMPTTPTVRPARTSTLTSMLMKRPKKALRSPRVQNGTAVGGPNAGMAMAQAPMVAGTGRVSSAASRAPEEPTQPKMPPWAAIIRSPISWNSGK